MVVSPHIKLRHFYAISGFIFVYIYADLSSVKYYKLSKYGGL